LVTLRHSCKGPWIKEKGLFPYDYIKPKARKCGYIVLVEGPRDALRLITDGIPALSVFGVQNFGVKKANFVSALGDVAVYIMSDNDAAGDVLFQKAKQSFKEIGIKVNRIKLPRKRDRSGNIIKMDPCSAPDTLIRNLKSLLREKHE
jgi:DNA primase